MMWNGENILIPKENLNLRPSDYVVACSTNQTELHLSARLAIYLIHSTF